MLYNKTLVYCLCSKCAIELKKRKKIILRIYTMRECSEQNKLNTNNVRNWLYNTCILCYSTLRMRSTHSCGVYGIHFCGRYDHSRLCSNASLVANWACTLCDAIWTRRARVGAFNTISNWHSVNFCSSCYVTTLCHFLNALRSLRRNGRCASCFMSRKSGVLVSDGKHYSHDLPKS